MDDLLVQQQQQQEVRQEGLASLRASIQEELQPVKEQLHDEALAALQSDVAQQVEVVCHALLRSCFANCHSVHS